MKTNKLISYYYTNDLYDTKLDSRALQQKRVHKWAEENNFVIEQSVVDDKYRDNLDEAFELAMEINGSVIVASNCRVADTLIGYLNIAEDKSKSLISTEVGSSTNRLGATMHMIQSLSMSSHESYINLCKDWL